MMQEHNNLVDFLLKLQEIAQHPKTTTSNKKTDYSKEPLIIMVNSELGEERVVSKHLYEQLKNGTWGKGDEIRNNGAGW